MRVRLPALGALATLRLFVSYQRYGFLLVGAPVAAFALAAAYAPWWLAAIVALAGIAPARFGIDVLLRWPRKLRATRLGLARMQHGSFAPASVRRYCSDPCFKVVARELLARAGVPPGERRALVRRFADEVRRERDFVVLVDHVNGTVTTLGGSIASNAQERT
ncbi:MAG: hypothetical protein ACM31C_25845 [Acidobacteriota bacterium]